jgi:signal transduction histidine kinase
VADPLLKVPHNRQLYGAVAVSTFKPGGTEVNRKLQPAMDRQGFVANEGFDQLRSIVRAGVELLAVLDVEEAQLRARRDAKREANETKKQIAAAIEEIQNDKSIPASARRAIIENYEAVAERVTRLDEARLEASRAVETMSLLGVLSGFMTHEATVMLRAAERMLVWLQKIPQSQRNKDYTEIVSTTREALQQLRLHLDYAETFVRGARATPSKPFKVRPQVELVRRQLLKFTDERGITVENDVPEALSAPGIPIAVYSGILLNLLTNGIKAILARGSWKDAARVRLEAIDELEFHVVRVSDTGIGVPADMRDRIFEPLFTTTMDSPLGAGMGLGLHIVRRLLRDLKGSIDIVQPADGFATCFEVRFRK